MTWPIISSPSSSCLFNDSSSTEHMQQSFSLLQMHEYELHSNQIGKSRSRSSSLSSWIDLKEDLNHIQDDKLTHLFKQYQLSHDLPLIQDTRYGAYPDLDLSGKHHSAWMKAVAVLETQMAQHPKSCRLLFSGLFALFICGLFALLTKTSRVGLTSYAEYSAIVFATAALFCYKIFFPWIATIFIAQRMQDLLQFKAEMQEELQASCVSHPLQVFLRCKKILKE